MNREKFIKDICKEIEEHFNKEDKKDDYVLTSLFNLAEQNHLCNLVLDSKVMFFAKPKKNSNVIMRRVYHHSFMPIVMEGSDQYGIFRIGGETMEAIIKEFNGGFDFYYCRNLK